MAKFTQKPSFDQKNLGFLKKNLKICFCYVRRYAEICRMHLVESTPGRKFVEKLFPRNPSRIRGRKTCRKVKWSNSKLVAKLRAKASQTIQAGNHHSNLMIGYLLSLYNHKVRNA